MSTSSISQKRERMLSSEAAVEKWLWHVGSLGVELVGVRPVTTQPKAVFCATSC